MPYKIVKGKGPRPWKIVNASTGQTVGTSLSRRMAGISVGHRMEGESKPKKRSK
jgi:hypothetical protein